MKFSQCLKLPSSPLSSVCLRLDALLDQVADFFFTDAGNISPVAVPVVEAVFDTTLSSLDSGVGSGVGLETSSIDVEESDQDEQAEKDSGLHWYLYEYVFDCYYILMVTWLDL